MCIAARKAIVGIDVESCKRWVVYGRLKKGRGGERERERKLVHREKERGRKKGERIERCIKRNRDEKMDLHDA